MLLSKLVELVGSQIGPSSAIAPVRWVVKQAGGDPDSLDPIFNRLRIEDHRADARQYAQQYESEESDTSGAASPGDATSNDVGGGGNLAGDVDASAVSDLPDGSSGEVVNEASGGLMEGVGGIFHTIGEWLSDAW